MKKYIVGLCLFVCVSGLAYFSFNSDANKDGDSLSQEINPTNKASEVARLSLIDLLNIENKDERRSKLKIFFDQHIEDNPFETVSIIEGLFDSSHRQLSFEIALLVWAENDKKQFHHWLSEKVPNVDLDQALTTLIQRYSASHQTVLVYADKLSDSTKRQSAIETVLQVWVLEDSTEAIQWAVAQKKESKTWVTFLFETLTNKAPVLAISSLPQLEGADQGLLDLAIKTIAVNLKPEQVNDELIAEIIGLESYDIHEGVVAALIDSLEGSVKEKDQLISLAHLAELIETLTPGDGKDQLIKLLARNWVSIDPFEAAKYAESFTGDARIIAVDGVVTSWSRSDPAYASEWLETLDGNIDIPANTLARGSANIGHIEVADKWLNNIQDIDIRTTAINDVVNEFYDADPRTGLHYLVYQKSLSEKQKLGFLHQVYPERVFISSQAAYLELSRDGSLKYQYEDNEEE